MGRNRFGLNHVKVLRHLHIRKVSVGYFTAGAIVAEQKMKRLVLVALPKKNLDLPDSRSRPKTFTGNFKGQLSLDIS